MDNETFLYDVYGRVKIMVVCHEEKRKAYRVEQGRRTPIYYDFVIPDGYTKEEICTFLDDMLHEDGGPGEEVCLIQPEN